MKTIHAPLTLTLTLILTQARAVPTDFTQLMDRQGYQFTMSGDADHMRADISNVWSEGVGLDPAGFIYFPQAAVRFSGSLADKSLAQMPEGRETFIVGIGFTLWNVVLTDDLGNFDHQQVDTENPDGLGVVFNSPFFSGQSTLSDDWSGTLNGEAWTGTLNYTIVRGALGGGSGSGYVEFTRVIPETSPTILALAGALLILGMIKRRR